MFTFSCMFIVKTFKAFKNGSSLARCYSRTILGEKVIPLTENTLLGRMMVYLNNPNKLLDSTLTEIEGSNTINQLIHGRMNVLNKLSVKQIENLFYTANISILNQSTHNLRKVLDLLDIECCLRLTNMEPNNVLKLLSAFMHVVPNRITEYKFYNYATDDIDRCLGQCSKQELIHFMFYIGLKKHSKKAQSMLRKCLRNLNFDSLTIEDLCIICNSTYRTKTKISNPHLLEKIKQTINDNLVLLKDPAFLITLIKTIQHNHKEDEDLLSTISCTIFFNKTIQYYSFTTVSHLLSLYAQYSYYDKELFQLFIKHCISQLENVNIKCKKTYFMEQTRTKDILIFLKSISYLNCEIIDKDLMENVVTSNMQQRIALGEFKNNLEDLLLIILYLWILGCRPHQLIRFTLTPHNLQTLNKNSNTNLLLSIIEYEDKELLDDLNVKTVPFLNFIPEHQLKSRPSLNGLLSVVETTSTGIEKFDINCQISHLNILGITGYKNGKEAVNLELLDEYTCLKNTDHHPNGFMQLKLRILEDSDIPLIVVRKEDVDKMDRTELKEFIENEILLNSIAYQRLCEKANARKLKYLDKMTPEQKEMITLKDREYYHRKKKKKLKQNSIAYQRLCEKANARKLKYLDKMTPEQKEMITLKDREYYHRKKG
ncbi:hypothetical protein FQA39_LY03328 [Lamprigera yunnana]|nr:hypothetical protein FQA39_LY03328 [Lamprigera yunnana]